MSEQTGKAWWRLLVLGVALALAGYWAGEHWGHHRAHSAEAVLQPSPSGSKGLEPDEAINVEIYRQASPAVANIITRMVEYDFFFNPVPVEGAGSGFLIDTEGHLLTNYHVVADAQTIQVTLGNFRRYQARLVGADPRSDIARLKIDPAGHKLTTLPLGDSDKLLVGQRVLAIGNPFGFQSTLTTGVVSALGRTVQTGTNTFIDDAAINRGNSGARCSTAMAKSSGSIPPSSRPAAPLPASALPFPSMPLAAPPPSSSAMAAFVAPTLASRRARSGRAFPRPSALPSTRAC